MSEKVIVNGNLKELHSSGFEMRKGEPDIRGWKVKNDQNRVIGKVDDLLFDTESLRVRYLVLDLEGKPLNLVSRDVLIPIGLAELDRADNIVLLPEVNVGHLAMLPEYKKGSVSIATEREIRQVFAPTEGVEYEDPDYFDPKEFYNHKYFDDNRMYRPRTNEIKEEEKTDAIIPRDENLPARIVRVEDEDKNKE
ncbi:MAG: PRC-barrel domain-containing protein [Ginsengibacter sp.]